MNEVATLEKIAAVFCLGHLAVNTLIAFESIRTAAILGRSWKIEMSFNSIAAVVLSLCVLVRWIA